MADRELDTYMYKAKIEAILNSRPDCPNHDCRHYGVFRLCYNRHYLDCVKSKEAPKEAPKKSLLRALCLF